MWPFRRQVVTQPAPIAPEPPQRRRAISLEAIAQASVSTTPRFNPFEIPPPPPGVVPSDRATMAQDEAFSPLNEWANGGLSGCGVYGEFERFRGYAYLAELAQRPEFRRGVEIISKEKTRKWIKLHSTSTDGGKEEYLAALTKALDKFRVQDVFRKADTHDGFFGRGQIYLDTGDRDNRLELRTPLMMKPQKIKLGGLKGIKAVEPIWTYPGSYNSSDPLHPHFYKPETWYVQGKEIHATRLISFVAREVPDLLKPAYLFGGLSLTQMAEPYVDNWLRARKSVSDLLNAFSTMVLSTDMAGTLGGDPGNDLITRVEMFNRYRTNRGTFVVDKANEDLKNVAAPLGGVDHLQAQAQEHLSSVYGIPLIVFFGITPSGLNASSQGELDTWEQWISAQQEHTFAHPLRVVLEAVQLSEFGKIDPDVTATFEPLSTISEVEKATIRKQNADAAAVYIADGVISSEEERERVASEEDGLWNGLDLSVAIEPPGAPLDPSLGGGMTEPDEGGAGMQEGMAV